MAGKTYSAGTIFLQVVPVFKDAQDAIRRNAKDIGDALGDDMEKSGADAGERASKAMNKELEKGSREAGKNAARETSTAFQEEFKRSVKGMKTALEPIELKLQDNEVRRKIKEVKDELDELDRAPIRLNADVKEAMAKFSVLHDALRGLEEEAKLNAKLDIKRALASAEALEKKLASVEKAAEIEVRMDLKQAERAMGTFEAKARRTFKRAAEALGDSMDPEIRKIKARLDELTGSDIGIDISSEEALREIDELQRRLRRLSLETADIDVKVDAGAAEAELLAFAAAVRGLDGKDVDIKVDVDAGAAVAKLGLLQSLLSGFRGAPGTDAAANSFRSFNAIVLAAVTLLPALIPVIGAVGGALLGLLPIMASVGAGFGAMLVGFSGIGDALTALGNQADSAAKDADTASKTMQAASYAVADARDAVADAERSAAQATSDASQAVADARRNAAQAEEDAARRVADARREAAQAVEEAIQRQQEAQEAYRDSVRDVQDAEAALAEARKRAAEEQAAESADVKDKIRQNALDIREAQLAAFDTTNAYNGVMADGASTAYDKESAEVAMLQARERLHELRDTQDELAQAAKDNAKEGVKDNDAVQSAQDALTSALERQRDAQEAVGEAAEAVAQARVDGARRVADAVRAQQHAEADGARAVAQAQQNLSRAQADGARSVADAQENLRRAQEAYGQALYDTGELGSASARAVEAAMDKLGPAGRKFALWLFGMREDFYKFRDAIQREMLPGVQRALQSLITTYGPQFTAFMAEMGGVVGRFFERMAASREGPAWRGFFQTMQELGPKIFAEFGDAVLNWMEGFASIMTAVAPFAERMSEAMLGMSDAFARWAASPAGQDAVTSFMEYAERVGPMVLDFLEAFVKAAFNLGEALAPWGEMVLTGLTNALNWIAEMDPKNLGLIAGAIIAITVAFQAAVGVVALVNGGMTVFALKGSRLIFFSLGLVGVLAALAIKFEFVHDALSAIVGFVGDHLETFVKLASAITTVVAAMRIWRAITATIAAVQIGLTAATYGSAGAAYAQGFAAKAAYVAARLWSFWTGAVALAQQGLLWATIRTNVATAIAIARQYAMAAAQKAAAAAQWLLNAAMSANPLGLIVIAIIALVAAIVILWKKNEDFRRIVTAAWQRIKDVAKVVWDAVVKGFEWVAEKAEELWKALQPVFRKVGDIISWVWNKVIKPVFKALGKVFTFFWKHVAKPYLTFLWKFWTKVFKGMVWAWKNILWPVIDLIFTVWKKWWTNVIFPIMSMIWHFWTKVFKGMVWVWKNILWPAIQAIFAVLKQLWKDHVQPVLHDIGEKWDDLMHGMKEVWERWLKPAWDAMKAGLAVLKDKFQNAVDDIKDIWNDLRDIIAVPIRFVLDSVINKGLIAGFNKVANFVGSDPMHEIPIPSWIQNAATGGIVGRGAELSYATGGVLPGYTPGHDVHHFTSPTGGRLNLSGGEAIMRPEFTAAVGSSFVDGINAAARAGGVREVRKRMGLPEQGFSKGGIFFPLPGGHYANDYPGHDGVDINYGSGDDDLGMKFYSATSGQVAYTGYDHGYGNAVFVNSPYGQLVYGHSLDGSIVVSAGQKVKPGTWLARVGQTGHATAPHLHFGFPNGTYAEAAGLLAGADPGIHASGAVEASKPHFPGWLIDIAKNPLGYLKEKISGPLDSLSDRFGGNGFVQMIKGVPGKVLGAVKDKMIDILPGPLEKIANGAAKVGSVIAGGVDAGLHAVGIGGRGDAPGGPAPEGDFYRGGILPYNGTMMYDAGGYLPPGLTTVMNLTGKPEPVLLPEQLDGLRGDGKGGIHYEPHFEGSDLTADEVMDDFEFTIRKMSRNSGGKYEGVRP